MTAIFDSFFTDHQVRLTWIPHPSRHFLARIFFSTNLAKHPLIPHQSHSILSMRTLLHRRRNIVSWSQNRNESDSPCNRNFRLWNITKTIPKRQFEILSTGVPENLSSETDFRFFQKPLFSQEMVKIMPFTIWILKSWSWWSQASAWAGLRSDRRSDYLDAIKNSFESRNLSRATFSLMRSELRNSESLSQIAQERKDDRVEELLTFIRRSICICFTCANFSARGSVEHLRRLWNIRKYR